MTRHRTHSIKFKRQVVPDYSVSETLHSLARRHDLSRNLIRIWIQNFEDGAFDDEAVAVDTIEGYEARIATLEPLVGRQALEIGFLNGALKHEPRPRSATTSVVTGPRHLCRRRMPADGDRALDLLR